VSLRQADRVIAMTDAEREQGATNHDTLQADQAASPRKPLTPAAQRALAEAAERRAQAAKAASERPHELQGPKGLEPTRYGDWERKGIASDF
jgi:hypothetical protein